MVRTRFVRARRDERENVRARFSRVQRARVYPEYSNLLLLLLLVLRAILRAVLGIFVRVPCCVVFARVGAKTPKTTWKFKYSWVHKMYTYVQWDTVGDIVSEIYTALVLCCIPFRINVHTHTFSNTF